MTNLAEGFMLISEQEKSGKVERRKDMRTMTSAYANKMLTRLLILMEALLLIQRISHSLYQIIINKGRRFYHP